MKTRMFAIAALVAVCSSTAAGWGAQGHRLVALLASHRLTPRAQQNVTWLLGDETLADVSSWADQYLEGNTQTALWHYLNIPPNATSYDRDRDCAASAVNIPSGCVALAGGSEGACRGIVQKRTFFDGQSSSFVPNGAPLRGTISAPPRSRTNGSRVLL